MALAKTGRKMDLRQRRFLRGSYHVHPLAYARFVCLYIRSNGRCTHTHTRTLSRHMRMACVVFASFGARCTDGAHNKITMHGHKRAERSKTALNVHFVIYYVQRAMCARHYQFSIQHRNRRVRALTAHTHTTSLSLLVRFLLVRKLVAPRAHIMYLCLFSANNVSTCFSHLFLASNVPLETAFEPASPSNARYISGKRTITQCRIGVCACMCVWGCRQDAKSNLNMNNFRIYSFTLARTMVVAGGGHTCTGIHRTQRQSAANMSRARTTYKLHRHHLIGSQHNGDAK